MNKSLIQDVPIAILQQWANPQYSPNNDLELMTDIMDNGILEPIEIGIGVWSRKIRLDTGNHRIYIGPRLGLTHLSVVCRVWNYCAFSNGNGDHSFDCQHITIKREWIEEEYYEKPSEALDMMSLLTNIL